MTQIGVFIDIKEKYQNMKISVHEIYPMLIWTGECDWKKKSKIILRKQFL